MKKYSKVFVIGDLHIPFHHRSAFAFLKAVKEKYKPDLVINIGDELDQHAISMHDSNPDLPSAGDELKTSKTYIKELEKIFPKMILIHSNHSSLVYRRALKYGLPREYLRSYNEFLGVGKDWQWIDDLTITLSDDSRCFFTHGMSADVLKLAMQMGKHCVQGHYHSKFSIGYFSNPDELIWGMQVGCLTSQSSMAFDYAKNFKNRFIMGSGMIIDGQPKLIPMVFGKDGEWIKKII